MKPVLYIESEEVNGGGDTFWDTAVSRYEEDLKNPIPLYTHPVKEQDDYCKAYWGNDNKFVDVFLPNSETEVIRFWNNTHPVKELTDEEIYRLLADSIWAVGLNTDCLDEQNWADGITVAKAILRKAQEK